MKESNRDMHIPDLLRCRRYRIWIDSIALRSANIDFETGMKMNPPLSKVQLIQNLQNVGGDWVAYLSYPFLSLVANSAPSLVSRYSRYAL